MIPKLLISISFAALLVANQNVLADEPPLNLSATDFMLKSLNAHAEFRDLLSAQEQAFVDYDLDGDGYLSEDDRADLGVRSAARRRGEAAAQFIAADLDADGVITADELRKAVSFDMRHQLAEAAPDVRHRSLAERDRAVASLMAADLNRDDRITLNEALTLSPLSREQQREAAERARNLDALLTLDVDRDETVTPAEFEAAFVAVFQAADTDGNGSVTQPEIDALRLNPAIAAIRADRRLVAEAEETRRRKQEAALAGPRCAMSRPSARAKLIAVSANDAAALSNVALGTQDEVTRTATVTIENGTEPLFMTISSASAAIWQFRGAVHRIEHVVLSSEAEEPGSEVVRAGATGIARERLSFTPARCLARFAMPYSRDARVTAEQITAATGREPDLMVGYNLVREMTLPADAGRDAEEKAPSDELSYPSFTRIDGVVRVAKALTRDPSPAIRELHDRLHRFAPGGVREIEATEVVSSLPATPYEVLPQEAGLIQLLQHGSLVRDGSSAFIINEQIRFPAGLTGSQKVTFRMAPDVSVPRGNPGQSDLLTAEGDVIDLNERTGSIPDRAKSR